MVKVDCRKNGKSRNTEKKKPSFKGSYLLADQNVMSLSPWLQYPSSKTCEIVSLMEQNGFQA